MKKLDGGIFYLRIKCGCNNGRPHFFILVLYNFLVNLKRISHAEARYGFKWVGCRHNEKRLPALFLDYLKSDSFFYLGQGCSNSRCLVDMYIRAYGLTTFVRKS